MLSKIPARWRPGKLLKLFTAAHFDVHILGHSWHAKIIFRRWKILLYKRKSVILKNGLIFHITVLTPASATLVSAKVQITEISSITAIILRSVFGIMRHSDLTILLLSDVVKKVVEGHTGNLRYFSLPRLRQIVTQWSLEIVGLLHIWWLAGTTFNIGWPRKQPSRCVSNNFFEIWIVIRY